MLDSERVYQETLLVDLGIYPIEAIRKAVYWLSKDIGVLIEPEDEKSVKLSFSSKSPIDLIKVQQVINDYSLRHQIYKETSTIRDLIAAKAFSHEEHLDPIPGELQDPLDIEKRDKL